MIACIVCSVCFKEFIIGEYPPYSRIGCVTDPFPPRHTTCATPGFTRAPSQPAQDQPSPPDRKPRLLNKRIILCGTKKCCRNVTILRYDRRARRAERAGQSFV